MCGGECVWSLFCNAVLTLLTVLAFWRRKSWLFHFVSLILGELEGSVSLPVVADVWYAICDCDIFWSYVHAFFFIGYLFSKFPVPNASEQKMLNLANSDHQMTVVHCILLMTEWL